MDKEQDSSSEESRAIDASAQRSGANLKLRDVQALNRSFRRLAEVQEALLVQMGEMERLRNRRERWLTPLLVLAGFCAAAAASWLAWVQINHPESPPEIQVLAPVQEPPTIVVQPTPVTVAVPESKVSDEVMARLLGEVDRMRDESREDRQRIAELTELLINREQADISRMANIGLPSSPVEEPASPPLSKPEATEASVTTEIKEPLLSPWLGAMNGLLALDGYPHFRFERGTRVEGEPVIHQVTLLVWDVAGLLDSVIKAEEVHFELHQMAGDLVVRFLRGTRTRAGAKHLLPEDGIRFDFADVDVEAWSHLFPELASLGNTDPGEIQRIREDLEELISVKRPSGYYRIPALGEVDGDVLKMVQVQRYDAAGHLTRVLDADSLELRLHPNGDVEMLFLEGAIFEGGVRRPFFDDRFRVYLPRQPLDDWRASCVPCVEIQ